ncbi:MAG: SAM-dependent methyltransferase [Acidobacteria bacterium]|nr:SAM-dependent methyltransferase [Acidobacteriota bacterium]
MTPLGEILAARIRSGGPILFSEFMDAALYHPELGYYRSPRDPFGTQGDFFTASQLQPVFGRLVAAAIRQYLPAGAAPTDFTVAEWGAGRAELTEALAEFHYIPIDSGSGEVPATFEGVVFSNELFDALPVDLAQRCGVEWRMIRVSFGDGRFQWHAAERLEEQWRHYASDLAAPLEDRPDVLIELPVRLRPVMETMVSRCRGGAFIAIDYGYTAREVVRFPQGTLMSYRRHQAFDDVLASPGEQDITAHVPFTYLERCAAECGMSAAKLENFSQFLLRAGETDQFAAALEAPDEASAMRLRLQLKTLLFGMGETFRVFSALIARPGMGSQKS